MKTSSSSWRKKRPRPTMGCFKASDNEAPKPPELDQSKAFEYRFVGSTLMLGKGSDALSLHPR